MRNRWIKRLSFVSLVLVGSGAVQLSCSVAHYLGGINPCGTLLNCDPVTYNFIKSDYQGPGANPNIDLACTYPPYCAGDPFVQTIPAGTTTTTTTKTRTNGLAGAP